MTQLIILRDPAGILGRDVRELDTRTPLQLQIEAAMQGGAECELLINGEKADPFTDPRLDFPPNEGDTVVVAHRPAGTPLIWVSVISGLLAVAAYASIPKARPTATSTESPNNRLTGQTNIARAYQAIPDVYGRRRVWPDLIQASGVVYENNVKKLTEWMVVSRGRGVISDVRFADTPFSEISGASWTAYSPGVVMGGFVGPVLPLPTAPTGVPAGYPEGLSTRVLDLAEAFQVEEVNGQELTASQPYLQVEAGRVTSFTDGTTATMSFIDGEQFDQIRAAALPLSVGTFVFADNIGESSTSVTRSGSITAVSTAGGQITLTCTLSAAVGSIVQPMTVDISPSGIANFNNKGPFTLPIPDANVIRWNTSFLRGLKGTVNILAEWWKVDAADVEIGGTRESRTFAFSGDTFDQQFRTEQVRPLAGPGRYKIEFTRQNPPNGDGSDVATLESLFGVRLYNVRDFVAQGVTIITFTRTAASQLANAGNGRYNLMWTREVRQLGSDTLSTSRNAFRAMAHLWTISGQPIGELDVTAMQAINSALGEDSPLLRFDGSLDDADMSVEERMQLIANHARCVFWRDGTKWTVTRDQARATPELQLDYRNLAASGQSTVNESFHMPGGRDGVEVEYVDETTQASKAYVRLNVSTGAPVAGLVLNPEKLQLLGCTTRAQAENRAQLEARKLIYQRTSVTETALGDAQQLGPLSLVRWVDPGDFAGDDGLQAGEVLGIAGAVLTLSEPPDFKGQPNGRIQLTGSDGMLLGPPVTCTPVSGQPYQVLLPAAQPGVYVASPPTSQVGSRYAFGVGLTQSEMASAGLYTVTEPRPNGDGTWTVAMVNYDRRIYVGDFGSSTIIAAGVGSAVASGLPFTLGDGVTRISAGVGSAVASGLPASIVVGGPISESFSDFGLTGLAQPATSGLLFRPTGEVARMQGSQGLSYTNYSRWFLGAVGGSWWVRFLLVNVVDGVTTGFGGGWLPLNVDRIITLQSLPLGYAEAIGTWEIAADAAGTDVRASGAISLIAVSEQ